MGEMSMKIGDEISLEEAVCELYSVFKESVQWFCIVRQCSMESYRVFNHTGLIKQCFQGIRQLIEESYNVFMESNRLHGEKHVWQKQIHVEK